MPWMISLVEPVPTDGLADEGCDERAGGEPGRQYRARRQYRAIRAIRTGREETPMMPATKPR
jgi:hypothetical protein